eukprot:CAMPEP_0179002858 /NCGR_PEP_ID=MMETSP0795-20121207/12307_1 /TAXON_ID=88552 /ORGANISM="Amoebophrya sp., Strain Ameob2" /LENGTH=344 /DNA_ID=CAMNT_0020696705 /DNA_START=106 /DNA_END=1141 /DNA_ORIENTATION=+
MLAARAEAFSSPAGPSRSAPFLKRTSSRDEQRGPSVEDASTSAGASRLTEAQGCECDPGQTESPQTFAQRREAEAEGETHQTLGTCECCEEKDSKPEDAGAKNSKKHHRQHEAAPTAAQKDENKTTAKAEKDEDEGCKLTQDMENDGMVNPVPLQGTTKFRLKDAPPFDPPKAEVMFAGYTPTQSATAHFTVEDNIGKIQQLTLMLLGRHEKFENNETENDEHERLKRIKHDHAKPKEKYVASSWEDGGRPWVERWIDRGWQPVLGKQGNWYQTAKNFDVGGDHPVVEDSTSTKLHFRPKPPLEPGKYRIQSGKEQQLDGKMKDGDVGMFAFRLRVCGDGPKGR